MQLENKKVVVLGGSSGIGLAAAELAKSHGAEIIIASRQRERLDRVAAEIGATAIVADITSDEDVRNLFERCGPVDHVVLTAATLNTGPFMSLSMEKARETMEGKFWGTWRVARMAEFRPGGSLTIVSGFLSIRPRLEAAVVGAANGAVEALVKSLAIEMAPIRINAVSPGIVDTPLRAGMPEEARRAMLDDIAAALPVGRVGTADDIARQIVTCMEVGFMTGSVIFLDGGGSFA
jgi:NAD(P)-dependent dehydrogenase (short-subunit alcohol dehydrogenase family)